MDIYGLVLSLKRWNSEYDIHAYDDSMFIFCQKKIVFTKYI